MCPSRATNPLWRRRKRLPTRRFRRIEPEPLLISGRAWRELSPGGPLDDASSHIRAPELLEQAIQPLDHHCVPPIFQRSALTVGVEEVLVPHPR
jgi:hypothetical protein